MNVLKEIFTKGTYVTKKEEKNAKRISFFSNEDQVWYLGEKVGRYTDSVVIVRYRNLRNKRMLALINESDYKVISQNLLYVSNFEGGMSVACKRMGSKINVILLNVRGQNVCNLGQRCKLYTHDVREMVK